MKDKQYNDSRELIEYIECSCSTEILRLYYYKWVDFMASEVELSMYTNGLKDQKTGIKEKLRLCRHILKYGTPYSNEIIIQSIDDIKALRDFFNKCLEVWDK